MLTGHPGGLKALLAIGFTIKIDSWAETVDLEHIVLPSNDVELTDDSRSTYLNLMLVMEEPDPSTNHGIALWSTWFDALKSYREFLANYAF